jgi:hypothetical protein
MMLKRSRVARIALIAALLMSSEVLANSHVKLANAASEANVVINEFEQNPPGPNSGYQWVELFNPTESDIDIGGWRLRSTYSASIMEDRRQLSYKISYGTIIPAGGFYVITFDELWLSLEDEYIILLDRNGMEVDKTPMKSDTYDDDRCWARCPDGAADWVFQASTKGRRNVPLISAISCFLSSSSITIESSVTIYGAISPSLTSPTSVTIWVYTEAWNTLTTVTSNSDGSYSYLWTPTEVRQYLVKASWPGDYQYAGATSSEVSLSVNKIPTTISCDVSPKSLKQGETIAISGSISHAHEGVTVTLTFTKPKGTIFTRTVTTDSAGAFTDNYAPDVAGLWNVSASWQGDWNHEGATSQTVSFTVEARAPEIASILIVYTFIIGVVVTAGLFFVKTRRPFPPVRPWMRPMLKPAFKPALCPTCREPLSYDSMRRRWYCKRCRKYM